MKCPNPNCHADNPNDAYFCHNCGSKLRHKVNGWRVFAILLFAIVIMSVFVVYDYTNRLLRENTDSKERLVSVSEQNNKMKNSNESLEKQLIEKDSMLNVLKEQLIESDSVLDCLKEQLPETYYTKYSNQDLYAKCSCEDNTYEYFGKIDKGKGIDIYVYLQKDGYGLTEYGWIPMNCLEKDEYEMR